MEKIDEDPDTLIEEQSLEEDALLFEDEDKNLLLRSNEGKERALPQDLYDKLSDISDVYDPTKEFIGYVDPVDGVVLVEASSLKEAYEQQKYDIIELKSLNSVSTRSTDIEQYFNKTSSPFKVENNYELTDNTQTETTSFSEFINGPQESLNIEGVPQLTSPPKTMKTMHQLAYESKTGRYVPCDDTRPISGFGIKEGKLLFNSTTFNAFNDEFHTEDRTMGQLEMERLSALVQRLNSDFEANKKTKLCLIM